MPRSPFLVLFVALASAACQRESSGSSDLPAIPANLGLSALRFAGAGDRWLVTVSEAEQGSDLDGDGDTQDEVVHWIDTASGSARNTGLALALPVARGDVVPSPVLAVGASFALGVSETDTGGFDRNGDGDGEDTVLALIDPESGLPTSLGLAVTHAAFAGEVVAFDVPELGQGEGDLDGDGILDPRASVPHFHDPRTGETWSSGLTGARVLAGDERRVTLAELESRVGDRNGDDDTLDVVLAFYDLATRSLQSAGLALPAFQGFPLVPHPHGGYWAVQVDEAAQGLGDLDGDGLLSGSVLFVVDPRAVDARILPGLGHLPMAEVVPFVLTESADGVSIPWLFDAASGRLERLNFACAGLLSLGRQLVMVVAEEQQGEDLDRNGVLDGFVPILFDPETRRLRNLGIDGFPAAAGERLWILSGEAHARTDWNDDGDRADTVLHVFDDLAGRLENTRLDFGRGDLSLCSAGAVLFLRSEDEAGLDLNADGDRDDLVTHLYDGIARRARNLGLAADFLLGVGGASSRAFLLVSESGQGADLNGDGDARDRVLHLVDP